MKRNFLRLAAYSAMLVILSFCTHAFGQPIPKLADVPGAIPEAQRTHLIKQRESLLQERTELKRRIDEHNQQSAPEGSPGEAQLRREGDALRVRMQKHVKDSAKYNETITAALKALDSSGQKSSDKPKDREGGSSH